MGEDSTAKNLSASFRYLMLITLLYIMAVIISKI